MKLRLMGITIGEVGLLSRRVEIEFESAVEDIPMKFSIWAAIEEKD